VSRRPHPLLYSLRLSLAADRRATLLTLVMFAVYPVVPIVAAYLVNVGIDAAIARRTTTFFVVAASIVVIAALATGVTSIGVEQSTRMIEATSALTDQRVMTLVGNLSSVAELEDPEVLDRVELLRQERVLLSEGTDAFTLLLGATVRAVATAAFLAFVNPLMLLTVLLAVPPFFASRRAERRRGRAVEGSAQAARLSRHLYTLGTSPAAARELRLFDAGEHLRRRVDEAARAADTPIVRAGYRGVPATAGAGLLFAVGFVGGLLIVVNDYANGRASIGEVVLTFSLVTMINLQVGQMIRLLTFQQRTLAAVRRLLWLERRAAPPATVDGAEPPDRLVDGIRLHGVSYRYPGGARDALDAVSLYLPAGAVVAVVGENGSGKSTLIKLLAGIYAPTLGTITVDGADLATLAATSWHAASSACFQDFAKLEFPVRDSVGAGDLSRRTNQEAVTRAVAEGAAAEVVAGLARGLQTPLGRSFDDGVELSGGQWQRIALARSRMRQSPVLLLLDEPTAAIDPLAEEEILSGYVSAAKRTTRGTNGVTVFASHRLSTVRVADLIIVVHAGAVVQIGTHVRLMADTDGRYHELYKRQSRAYAD
jgi:ATP-binding cassette subfamily B protein/ATP-binding cassette subfamily C protein